MRIPKKLPGDLPARKQAISDAIAKVGASKLAKELGLRTTWAMYKWAEQGYVTNAHLKQFCKLTKANAAMVCDPDISSMLKRGTNTTKSR